MKTKSLLLTVIILCAALTASAFSGDAQIGGIYYNIVTKSAKATVIKSPNGYSGDVNIPPAVEYDGVNCSVQAISNEAFRGNTKITSITIPTSVQTIGSNAFYNCSGIEDIVIPNSVTTIGSGALYGCKNLHRVTLSSKLTTIPSGLFYECTTLKTVTIPHGVTTIEESAFAGCSMLFNVSIPKTVTYIGKNVFSDCTSMVSATLPESIEIIPAGLFSNCTSLESIVIPEGIKAIGEGAFSQCSGLLYLTIPSTVEIIGDRAFYGLMALEELCISDLKTWAALDFDNYSYNPMAYAKRILVNGELLTDLVIPTGTTAIGRYTFPVCKTLTSVTIPTSVETIGMGAFYYNDKLKTVTIGSGVKKMESSAFEKCADLTDVYCYATSLPEMTSSFKNAYIEEATLHVPSVAVGTYKDDFYWGKFGTVVALGTNDPAADMHKCGKPTVSYQNGKIMFKSTTKNVEFKSMVTNPDVDYRLNPVIPLSVTYTVSVMATRKGYEPSDVTVVTINWLDNGTNPTIIEQLKGDVNGDGQVDVGDIMAVINYMAGQTAGITPDMADVNGDKQVDVGDIMAIINIMASPLSPSARRFSIN